MEERAVPTTSLHSIKIIMLLLTLPTELFLAIGTHVTSERDINALTQTSRRSHALLNAYLYSYNAHNHELTWAAERNQLAAATKSIAASSPPEPPTGREALCNAARRGYVAIATLLLDNGINSESECKERRTPLLRAVQNHQTDMVRLLLERGVWYRRGDELAAGFECAAVAAPCGGDKWG
jgi:ankyrin repeat protein